MVKRLQQLKVGEKITTSGAGYVYKDRDTGDYFLYDGASVYKPTIKRLGVECLKTETGWDVTLHSLSDVSTMRGIGQWESFSGGFARIDRLYKRSLSGRRTLIYIRDGVA